MQLRNPKRDRNISSDYGDHDHVFSPECDIKAIHTLKCVHEGVPYDVFTAKSLLDGAGMGLFLRTGDRAVGAEGGSWKITEYRGTRIDPERVDSDYAMKFQSGDTIDGEGCENKHPMSIGHFVNMNFSLKADAHNAFLGEVDGEGVISTNEIFLPNTVTEIYVFYSVEYWTAPRGRLEDSKNARWAKLPTHLRLLFCSTYREEIQSLRRENPQLVVAQVLHTVNRMPGLKNAREAKKARADRKRQKMGNLHRVRHGN